MNNSFVIPSARNQIVEVYFPMPNDSTSVVCTLDTPHRIVFSQGDVASCHTNLNLKFPQGTRGYLETLPQYSSRGIFVTNQTVFDGLLVIKAINTFSREVIVERGQEVFRLTVLKSDPYFDPRLEPYLTHEEDRGRNLLMRMFFNSL